MAQVPNSTADRAEPPPKFEPRQDRLPARDDHVRRPLSDGTAAGHRGKHFELNSIQTSRVDFPLELPTETSIRYYSFHIPLKSLDAFPAFSIIHQR